MTVREAGQSRTAQREEAAHSAFDGAPVPRGGGPREEQWR